MVIAKSGSWGERDGPLNPPHVGDLNVVVSDGVWLFMVAPPSLVTVWAFGGAGAVPTRAGR